MQIFRSFLENFFSLMPPATFLTNVCYLEFASTEGKETAVPPLSCPHFSFFFASSQMASISARVMSVSFRPAFRVCFSR